MSTRFLECSPPHILIVDDTPENLEVLFGLLTSHGYVVRPAPDGEFALNFARTSPPDLILLDIKMPDLNGYEVCEQLQADERTRAIPVIFLSALDDVEDKVKGFDAGGVDYITKPFHAREVLARVNTHLTLRRAQQALQQEIIRRREVEASLREANASKDRFFSIIAHDLRNPFTTLIGLSEALLESSGSLPPDKLQRFLRQIHTSAQRTHALLVNLLEWSRLQGGLLKPVPGDITIAQLIKQTIPLFVAQAGHKQITVRHSAPETLMACADQNMIATALRNLLSNALKFTPTGGMVDVTARARGYDIEISIADTGIGIEAQDLDALFRIDVKLSKPGTAEEDGTGLGLMLCKELIELNGGTLRVVSAVGQGTTVSFTLPRKHVSAADNSHV